MFISEHLFYDKTVLTIFLLFALFLVPYFSLHFIWCHMDLVSFPMLVPN